MRDYSAITPRGLSRVEAARYIGVGPTLFDELVKSGRMPAAKRLNSRTIWDRKELDVYFNALPTEGVAPAKADPFAFMDE